MSVKAHTKDCASFLEYRKIEFKLFYYRYFSLTFYKMAALWNTVQYERRGERSGVRIPAGESYFAFLKKVKKKFWGPPSLLLRAGTRPSLLASKMAGGVKMTTHLPVVPRIRMSGPIPPFLLYSFMKCTNNLTFFFLFPPIINYNWQGLTEKQYPLQTLGTLANKPAAARFIPQRRS